MSQDIEEIKNRLTNLESKVDKILLLIENNLINNCSKMGEHIDFIDNVYKSVKQPLQFISDKVNYISSNSNYKELPEKIK